MNKKMILVTSLVFMLATAGSAMAASGNGQGTGNRMGSGQGTGQHMAYQGTMDGNGVCDNVGTGRGANFVDANGDGICDNGGGTHPQDGSGMGMHRGAGQR